MNSQKKLLIPFFTAGFPELESTKEIILAFDHEKADYIEIGLPHSDALADGPVIQASSSRALENGMNIEILCQQIASLKGQIAHSKLILFSYYNPLLCYGLEAAAKLWKEAGGAAILIPDLPIEEAEEFLKICKTNDLNLIFLVAPTSTPERIKSITALSECFIYLVSVTGVTGVRSNLKTDLSATIKEIKKNNPEIPVVIGFGIGNAEQSKKAIEQGADGVVVGSAIVKMLNESNGLGKCCELLSEMRQVI